MADWIRYYFSSWEYERRWLLRGLRLRTLSMGETPRLAELRLVLRRSPVEVGLRLFDDLALPFLLLGFNKTSSLDERAHNFPWSDSYKLSSFVFTYCPEVLDSSSLSWFLYSCIVSGVKKFVWRRFTCTLNLSCSSLILLYFFLSTKPWEIIWYNL